MTEWEKTRMRVLVRDEFICVYCIDDATQVDHVVPVCQGGTNDLSNLVAACARCNQSKGGLTAVEWFKRDNFRPPFGWDEDGNLQEVAA